MSLRTRIALVVSGFTILVVLISGSAIHQFTEDDIRDGLDRRLSWQVTKVADPEGMGKLLTLGRFFRVRGVVPGRVDLEEEYLDKLLDVQIPTRVLIGDETIIATSGFPDFPQISFPSGFSDVDANGTMWRVRTETFRRPISRSPRSFSAIDQITVQAAITRGSISTTLHDFRERFLVVGVLAVLVSGLGGWFLGGTVLQPLNRLRRYTENVRDSQDLSQRVPERLGPSEVEALAESLNGMLSELELNVEKTEQALSSSRSFASNVAHELRTPLTSMRMNLDLLGRHPDMDLEERSEILANIINGQDRLLSSMESLRLLARGDLSESEVFEEIDFVQFIREIVSRHQHQWTNVDIKLHLPPVPPLVLGWREGLTVLFRNVIENACVHARIPSQDLIIDISVDSHGKELNVNIDDNGIGIPASERDQVFERFKRGSRSTGTGSGLGLSLIKQQAGLHGGSVMLLDSPSEGARISVILPIIILLDSL